MTVTKIQAVTKQKYQIEIDGQPAFVLYKGELSRYHIREGQDIAEEVYQEITGQVLVKRAKLRAMHLLQKMDRTESDLYNKLVKSGYPISAVETAIAYVKSYGYINDREYARCYVENQKERKGSRRLAAELYQKGISQEIISQVLECTDFSDTKETIRLLVEKKKRGKGELDEKEVRRLFGFLARKGFESNEIWSVLREGRECWDTDAF